MSVCSSEVSISREFYDDSASCREFYSDMYPYFDHLCPEGCLLNHTASYLSSSNFDSTHGPIIQGAISSFLRDVYPARIVHFLAQREVSGSNAVQSFDHTLTPCEIKLHGITELFSNSHGVHCSTIQRDRRRHDQHQFLVGEGLSAHPRITIVPKGPYPRSEEVHEAGLATAAAIACSLRAYLGMYAYPLSYLTWDVGLFTDSVDYIPLLSSWGDKFPHTIQRTDGPFSKAHGAMLLLRPINGFTHFRQHIAFTGGLLPIVDAPVATEHFWRYACSHINSSVYRLSNLLREREITYALTFSPTGIRILTADDVFSPLAGHDTIGFIATGGPLGIEITLPIGATLSPRRFKRGLSLGVNRPLPQAVLHQQSYHGSWLVEAVERNLRDDKFEVIFRAYYPTSTAFRVRLYLVDVHPSRNVRGLLYEFLDAVDFLHNNDSYWHVGHYSGLGSVVPLLPRFPIFFPLVTPVHYL